jgi:NosR/NirI family transcriptional regulator, nitrous oxide reductase regulator
LSRPCQRLARAALLAAAWLAAAPAARAGVLSRERLAEAFPPPMLVGEREKDLPIWPIFKQSGPPSFTTDLVGYAFESVDLAPIPGFAGVPINLLVAVDPAGAFLDVRLVSQHEPVFVGGLGVEPLVKFVTQYKGLRLEQNVKVGRTSGGNAPSDGTHVVLDGVAKATASLRVVHQSVLSSALRVARARLGFSGAQDPDLVARVRPELFEQRSWRQLEEGGLLTHLTVRNADVERAFSGTPGAGIDAEALAHPDDAFVDVWAGLGTVPTVGRNLLDDRAWSRLQARVDKGDQVLLVLTRGRWAFADDDFVRGSVPDRLILSQGGLGVEMRDLDLDGGLRPSDGPAVGAWKAFRVISQAGLDPGVPMRLALRITRARGTVYPERITREVTLDVTVPGRWLVPAPEDPRGWRATWKGRAGEIAVLVAALALLAWVLARKSPLVTETRKLRWFRPAFLAFTLAFVGFYAQGQLSIVNVVALLQATLAGQSWAFFLFDPMSTVLWAFVLVALVIWGRGTFCGWLCPFGALQELVAGAARLARLPRRRFSPGVDRALKRVKYGLLLAVLAAAVAAPRWADRAVEIEPFKTAITLAFARSWPFVAWAGGLVAAGAVVDKLFCRYLCPLGAFLALGGRLRRFAWIPRRPECGHPCQTCRHRCEYQAIEADGRIDYAECFQCMDCVAVHRDVTLCTPLIMLGKGRIMKVTPPRPEAR